jgi:hypothetical protein
MNRLITLLPGARWSAQHRVFGGIPLIEVRSFTDDRSIETA